jgi:hypothetical protein
MPTPRTTSTNARASGWIYEMRFPRLEELPPTRSRFRGFRSSA